MSPSEPALKPLERWVGNWRTEATHPAMPGVVVHGTAAVEWLEGQRFLIHRARTDHSDFPDSISIIGFTDRDRVGEGVTRDAEKPRLNMHYYDSRGVYRVYEASADAEAIHFLRSASEFSQRFTGKFSDDGDWIAGRWQMSKDDAHWEDDLQITYTRQK